MAERHQGATTLLAWPPPVGRQDADATDVALQTSLLIASTLMMGTLAIFWGALYFVQGEPLAAAIPWGYTAICCGSLLIFRVTRRYRLFRFSQLLFSLLLPFLLMLALGGFADGSAVILWSLSSPLGALLFAGPRQAVGWFLGFLGLIAISLLAEPFVATGNNLGDAAKLAFLVMNVLGVSLVVFVLTLYFVRQKNRTLDLLALEQRRAERLLLNVLPRDIAATLKQGEQTIAERHEAVTVMFADIVGFTQLSASLSAIELTALLNRLFSRFDEMVVARGLEKIRTIGDAYMVASGVPQPRPDHARAVADLALEMLTFTSADDHHGRAVALRIGIASGPVTAGVIGHLKFCYDVWGDTVNVASRMATQGQANRIQLTQGTRSLLAGTHRCVPRGMIEVKGKGAMETWFLEGRLDGPG